MVLRAFGATFVTLPGASFVVNGARQPRDAWLSSTSAELKFITGWSLAGVFESEYASSARSYAGKGRADVGCCFGAARNDAIGTKRANPAAFVFACGATIATLTRSRAGAIARSASGASFVSAVIEDCTRVATAAGYPSAPAPDMVGLIRGICPQPDSTYGPSILIDMEDCRPTEGEHTIGDMVERAARGGVSAPILNAARCNLQASEINRSNPKWRSSV